MIIKNGPSWFMVSFKNYCLFLAHSDNDKCFLFEQIILQCWHYTLFFTLLCQVEILTLAQYFKAKVKDQGLDT